MKTKIWLMIKAFLITFAVVVPVTEISLENQPESGWFLKFLFFVKSMFDDRAEIFAVLFICVFLVLFFLNQSFAERRYTVIFGTASGLFAILMVCSRSFAACGGLSLLFGRTSYWFRTLLLVWGTARFFFEASRILLTSRGGQWLREKSSGCRGYIFESRYRILWLTGILALCWLPYFILCCPGNATLDFQDEMAQYFQNKEESWTYNTVIHDDPNDNALINHQPVAYTCLSGVLAAAGKKLGDINIGIALLTLLQMAAAIAVIVRLLLFMYRRKVPLLYRYAVLAFFCLFPVFPMFAVTLTKDMLFAVAMLWGALELAQFILEGKKGWGPGVHGWLFLLAEVLMCLFRNNGVYILVGMVPFVLAMLPRGMKIKTCILVAAPICFYFVGYLGILLPAAGIANGSRREMLCVPFQQVARYVSEWGVEELEEEDIAVIDRVLRCNGDITALSERYRPTYADTVKAWFNKEAGSDEVKDFLRVWLKIVAKHPGTAVAATLHNNFQLTYMQGSDIIVYVNQIERTPEPNWYGIQENLYGRKGREDLRTLLEFVRQMPVAGLLFSIGFYDWVLLFFLCVLLAKKRYSLASVGMLFVFCVATSILGPVIYMRYAIQWIMGIPLMGSLLMVDPEIRGKE